MTPDPPVPPFQPLGLLHCTLTGSVALGVLFLLAWTTSAFADVDTSRRWFAILSRGALGAPPPAFAEGLASSLAMGGVAGAVLAITYNLLAVVRRP